MQELGAEGAPKFGTREGFMAGGVSGAARSTAVRTFEKITDAIMKNGANARNQSLAEAISGNRAAVVDALARTQQDTPMSTAEIERLTRALLLNGGLTVAR